MSWTNLPADENTDWSHRDFASQFFDAINERLDALDRSDEHLSWAFGGDLQHFQPWNDLQAKLEDIVEDFVELTAVAAPYESGSFDLADLSSIPDWSLNDWRAAAGIPENGFTRKFPRVIQSTSDSGSAGQRARYQDTKDVYEHDGSTWVLLTDATIQPDLLVDYGYCQAGDYVGAWIFNELHEGLRLLLATKLDNDKTTEGWAFDDDGGDTCGEVWSEALANYNASTFDPIDSLARLRWQGATENTESYGPYQVGWSATCDVYRQRIETESSLPLGADVDLIFALEPPDSPRGVTWTNFSEVFDASPLGLGSAYENRLAVLDSAHVAANSGIKSFDVDLRNFEPPDPGCAGLEGPDSNASFHRNRAEKGHYVNGSWLVAWWDFTHKYT